MNASMETLNFEFIGGQQIPPGTKPVLAGVVGSGNLEVLLEAEPGVSACRIQVVTSAIGFEPIWLAVLRDFFERHHPAGLRVSINDVGATPAVVSLRLDQAMEALKDAAK
jgi:malonate decarboxylase delta subunit